MCKYTKELFINRANEIHNNKYDYSLVEYINSKTNVIILCKTHGVFEQSPNRHLSGNGCIQCGYVRDTTESYINKAKKIHNDKYDYSLVEYINCRERVKIICPIHGIFYQIANYHLSGCGCKKCIKRHKTLNYFTDKARKIHGDAYDYTLTEYINSNLKVKITCKQHGVFEQTPKSHISGSGCPECSIVKDTKETFINKANIIHGCKYDYSLVEYVNCKTKIKILCKQHGVFEQIPYYHLSKNGCKMCSKSYKKTTIYFINKANIIHDNKYDYSLVEYDGMDNKVKIICLEHGVFEQRASDHLNNSGCPICKSSKGELKIKKILEFNNIKYQQQQKFDGCKYKHILSFDFYLPKDNICIEFDGRQHFEIVEKWGGIEYLKEQIIKDDIKNSYCKDNNIILIRIKYNENIEHKLKEYNII